MDALPPRRRRQRGGPRPTRGPAGARAVAGRPGVVPASRHGPQRQCAGVGRWADLLHGGRGPPGHRRRDPRPVVPGCPRRLQRRSPVEAARDRLGLEGVERHVECAVQSAEQRSQAAGGRGRPAVCHAGLQRAPGGPRRRHGRDHEDVPRHRVHRRDPVSPEHARPFDQPGPAGAGRSGGEAARRQVGRRGRPRHGANALEDRPVRRHQFQDGLGGAGVAPAPGGPRRHRVPGRHRGDRRARPRDRRPALARRAAGAQTVRQPVRSPDVRHVYPRGH